MESPQVLAIVPLYNARLYVRAALESMLTQTYPNLKVLVINDGSTDGSAEIVEEMHNRGIILWHQQNQGPGAAMNWGIKYAFENQIEFIARMDADDISMPNRIEKQIALLQNHPGAAACSANCYYVDANAENVIGTSTVPTSNKMIQWEISRGLRGLIQGVSLFRTEPIHKIGGYRLQFRHAEETDLFLRLAESYEFINSKDFLAKIRVHPDSLSMKDQNKNIQYQFYAVDCAKRRSRGESELAVESFVNNANLGTRFKIWREERLLKLWRDHMKSRSIIPLLLAGMLDPERVCMRLMRKILR